MKGVELYIKGGEYSDADILFNNALALGNTKQKFEMKGNYKNYYLTQARIFLNGDKRSNAKKILEKVLRLDLDIGERREVQKQLLDLYKKLGNVQEYMSLKKNM